jgi:cellobiose phosphorylase
MSTKSPSNVKGGEGENELVNKQLRDRRSLRAYIYALMAFKQQKKHTDPSKMSEEEIKEHVLDQGEDAPRTVSKSLTAYVCYIQLALHTLC